MADPITHTLKPSGGDYTSIATWESTEERNLVSADETETLECYKGNYSGSGGGENYIAEDEVVVAAWTTNSTHTLTLKTPASERHDGTPKTGGDYSGFAMQGNVSNYVIGISQPDFFMEGLILDNISTSFSTGVLAVAIDTIDACICIGSLAGYNHNGNNMIAHNVLGIAGTTAGITVAFVGGIEMLNCLGQGGVDGIDISSAATGTLRNNVGIGGSGSGFSNDPTSMTRSNNAANDTTAPGSDPQNSIVLATEFVDTANDDYHLDSGSEKLKENGFDVSGTLDFDIDGDVHEDPYSIGIDAFVAAGGPPPSLAMGPVKAV